MAARIPSAPRAYLRRPARVEAMRLATPYRAVIDWCAGIPVKDGPSLAWVIVRTPPGDRRALPGDWIVKDTSGDFAVLTPAEFAREYELAPGPPAA